MNAYSKRLCPLCQRRISANGLAWASHKRMHRREQQKRIEAEHEMAEANRKAMGLPSGAEWPAQAKGEASATD